MENIKKKLYTALTIAEKETVKKIFQNRDIKNEEVFELKISKDFSSTSRTSVNTALRLLDFADVINVRSRGSHGTQITILDQDALNYLLD